MKNVPTLHQQAGGKGAYYTTLSNEERNLRRIKSDTHTANCTG